MKKLILTLAVCVAATITPTAAASPALCGSHADLEDSPFGYATSAKPGAAVGADPTYVTACGGDGADAIGSTAAGGTVTVPHLDSIPTH